MWNTPSTILITCPLGISPFLEQEVTSLGFEIQKKFKAGVRTRGSLKDCINLNWNLRTGYRVLFQLTQGVARSPEEAYKIARKVKWEAFIPLHEKICVLGSVKTESITNTQFANVKVKDAIVDRFREKCGERPDSTSEPNSVVVFVYWHNDEFALYLDTSGVPLTKRGYRTMPHKAPMAESLAAACLMASKLEQDSIVIAPMCGSGTLAIEAALMQHEIAPGSFRKDFAFTHLIGFDSAFLEEFKKVQTKNFKVKIFASDIDTNAIEAAKVNARNAGVLDLIDFRVSDFRNIDIEAGRGIAILNPEYGERLGAEKELEVVYEEIGDFFKKKCAGKWGYVFTGNRELAKHIGLKPKRKIEFFNADIECRLFEFELYDGTRRTDKTAIGKVIEETYNKHTRKNE